MNNNFFSREIKSFGYAISGIAKCFKNEIHFKFHIATSVVVIAIGFGEFDD